MARKLTAIAQIKLRIRESLRRRLEQAAKRQDRSLNSEIAARLQASFDQADLVSLSKVAANMDNVWTRYAREREHEERQQELVAAVEALIERLPPGTVEAYPNEHAWLQKAIADIVNRYGRQQLED